MAPICILSNQISETDWKGEENTYPYPTGEDAVKIGDAMQSLFNTLDEKTDESGNTVLFSLVDDKANFSSALEDFKNGVLNKFKPVTVTSDTPSVILNLDLSDLGLRVFNRKITMPYSVIEKAIGNIPSTSTGDFHAIDIETLKLLPENMHNPVMILEGNLPGTIEIYTMLFDKNNDPIMVALAIDVTEKIPGKRPKEYVVNSIRSIYGKENHNTPINKLKNGQGRYVDIKKAEEWSRAAGVQFPSAGEIISGSPHIIIVDDSKVNPSLAKNPEKSSGGEIKRSMSTDLTAADDADGIKFSRTGDLDVGDTTLSPEDYRRSIDPLFDFVLEHTDGIVNPGADHIGENGIGHFPHHQPLSETARIQKRTHGKTMPFAADPFYKLPENYWFAR